MRSKTYPLMPKCFGRMTSFASSGIRSSMESSTSFWSWGGKGWRKAGSSRSGASPTRTVTGTEFSVAHYIKGNITPVEAYQLAYEHRNKLLVFDDGERLVGGQRRPLSAP